MQTKKAEHPEKIKKIALPHELKYSYLPYKSTFPELGSNYIVKRELGRGSYGVTYKIVDKNQPKKKYALKRLFALTQAKYILLEIYYLRLLYEKQNIISYNGAIRIDTQVDLLFEYIPHEKFSILIDKLDLKGIKRYMFQLLRALSVLESYGIIHRDVKPANFLYSSNTNRGVLIDFGLSELVNYLLVIW
jgi:cell division control protein 7